MPHFPTELTLMLYNKLIQLFSNPKSTDTYVHTKISSISVNLVFNKIIFMLLINDYTVLLLRTKILNFALTEMPSDWMWFILLCSVVACMQVM